MSQNTSVNNKLELAFGNVASKRINTPNDFVSHMVEHIAWRMGCSIDLEWPDEDWTRLGQALGARIRGFTPARQSAAAMSMIDDGSAEVLIDLGRDADLEIKASAAVDLDWFLSLRCEQMTSGAPLLDLLTGLAGGLEAGIKILVCSHEDTHHTWEGIFRSIGVALYRIFAPAADIARFSTEADNNIAREHIKIVTRSAYLATIERETAETALTLSVDFNKQLPFDFEYEGSDIQHYSATNAIESFRELLWLMCDAAGFSMRAVFSSQALSSSHVMMEDTGMVLGKALAEVLVKRMMDLGIHGSGSSIHTSDDFHDHDVSVAVSVEGRKLLCILPLEGSRDQLKKNLLVGQTIMNGLFSEDLDDFFDGLSWGLGCGIVIHVRACDSPEDTWKAIFEDLGKALAEVFKANPSRKGLPPGVKANLS